MDFFLQFLKISNCGAFFNTYMRSFPFLLKLKRFNILRRGRQDLPSVGCLMEVGEADVVARPQFCASIGDLIRSAKKKKVRSATRRRIRKVVSSRSGVHSLSIFSSSNEGGSTSSNSANF